MNSEKEIKAIIKNCKNLKACGVKLKAKNISYKFDASSMLDQLLIDNDEGTLRIFKRHGIETLQMVAWDIDVNDTKAAYEIHNKIWANKIKHGEKTQRYI